MNNKKEDNVNVVELLIELLMAIPAIVLIWITLMGFTFWFTKQISYTLGFWVYGILSSFLGLVLTQYIINKARTKH
jgi:ABC-type phosphate transport system permease subunit